MLHQTSIASDDGGLARTATEIATEGRRRSSLAGSSLRRRELAPTSASVGTAAEPRHGRRSWACRPFVEREPCVRDRFPELVKPDPDQENDPVLFSDCI